MIVVVQTAIRSTLRARRPSTNIRIRKKPATNRIKIIRICCSKLRTFCRPLMMSTTSSISQVKPTIVPITIQTVNSDGVKIRQRPSRTIKMPRNKSLLPEIFKESTKPSRNLPRKLGSVCVFRTFFIYASAKMWYIRRDSNPRPLVPKTSALIH